MMPIQRLIFAASLCATACVDTNVEVTQTEQDVVLPGYELVEVETVLDPMSSKQLLVECPKGKQVLGVGWEGLDNTRAFMHAIATYSAPSYDGRSWLLNAKNVSSWSPTWRLHVQVACVTSPSSYEIVTTDSLSGQVEVACPPDKVTTGGGFGLLDTTGAILDGETTYFEPGWDGRTWLINGRGYGSAKLRGFAVCVGNTQLPGYQVVTATSPLDPVSYKQLIVSCPPPAVATGAGWGVLDATGAIYDGSGLRHAWWGSGGWLTNGWNNVAGDWKLQVRLLCVQ